MPADLSAALRTYQGQGVAWLAFLRRAGLGALLADDMGLGKTLQSLCALDGPSLVVPPTSEVHNWAAEAARFRPSLKVSLYHGPDRALDAKADLTVTSYALLRLDVKKLEGSSLQTGRHLHETTAKGSRHWPATAYGRLWRKAGSRRARATAARSS